MPGFQESYFIWSLRTWSKFLSSYYFPLSTQGCLTAISDSTSTQESGLTLNFPSSQVFLGATTTCILSSNRPPSSGCSASGYLSDPLLTSLPKPRRCMLGPLQSIWTGATKLSIPQCSYENKILGTSEMAPRLTVLSALEKTRVQLPAPTPSGSHRL